MSSIGVSIDQADVDRQVDLISKAVLTQAKGAVRSETRGLEKDFEDLTKRTVGGKLWRAWKSEIRPKGNRLAYEPAGTVFVNGGARSQAAMVYFSTAGINRPRKAKLLAYPTEHAGPMPTIGPEARIADPRAWARNRGIELFERHEPGEPIMLMGVVGTGDQRKAVPFFILIPQQRFANSMSLEPLVERRGKMAGENFTRRMRRLNNVSDGLRE